MKTRLLFEDASYPDYRACGGLFLFPTFPLSVKIPPVTARNV